MRARTSQSASSLPRQLIPSRKRASITTLAHAASGPTTNSIFSLASPTTCPQGKDGTYRKSEWAASSAWTRTARRETYATGLRNPEGVDFNPKDKSLWINDNQVDGMGDDIPPGEINHIDKIGENFGFPWYGGGHTRTNEYKNDTPPADVVFPEVEQVAHAADLGLSFYTGDMFPAKYKGAIFSTQHGSWNRTVPVGARVMVTFLKDDGHVAGPRFRSPKAGTTTATTSAVRST